MEGGTSAPGHVMAHTVVFTMNVARRVPGQSWTLRLPNNAASIKGFSHRQGGTRIFTRASKF